MAGVRRLSLLLYCLTLLLAGRAEAFVEIPMEHRAGLIWLRVTPPNGAAPLHFLLDSGAGVSVLNLPAARALGQKLDSPRVVRGIGGRALAFEVARVELRLAHLPLPSPRLALDLSAISRACGRPVDGLIGADFFREHIVQIDFRAQKLRLLSREELPHAMALPLVPRGDALCVRATVNGLPAGWARVDTGCDTALEWRPTEARTPAATTSIAAGSATRATTPATVQLGPLRIADVPTGFRDTPIFAGESGLLGNGLLARFTVTFDVAKKRLFLAPN
jgi:hypothetical protein